MIDTVHVRTAGSDGKGDRARAAAQLQHAHRRSHALQVEADVIEVTEDVVEASSADAVVVHAEAFP